MYKVFFNDRTIFLTDEFSKHFQVKYGLFYKYRSINDLKELIGFFSRLKKIDTLFLFHHDIEELRDAFRACFIIINAAGGLVRNPGGDYLFIKRRGKWDLPKGKLDDNETFEMAARREVMEECGLEDLQIVYPLLSTYHTYPFHDSMALKKTSWFEMLYSGSDLPVPQTEEDITEIKWFRREELQQVSENTFKSVLDVMRYTNLVDL
ncbi:MAG: NUDIX domain-containing protein [Bacteroidales bacterium]|nr:NUDIX domain-containing protein [Bacteroidales bacterium]